MGLGGILDKVDDPSFATAAGLVLWGLEQGDTQKDKFIKSKAVDMFTRGTGDTVEKMRELFKKFLP